MDDVSERQKVALLEGGFWINMPAAALKGEVIKTIIMPGHDRLLAIKDFLACQDFDEKARSYQITQIPLYEDREEMHAIAFKHVGYEYWEDFLTEIGSGGTYDRGAFSEGLEIYSKMTGPEIRGAFLKYLNL